MMQGWYFKVDSTLISIRASKSPTYPTHTESKANIKL
jgi:hypothetical protein